MTGAATGDAVARAAAPVACRSPQPAAVARLVCFAHAGGGPMAFRGWARGLAPDVEVWTATLPGRAGRVREPLARSWRPLVEEMAAAVAERVPPPVALFGHSLGALIAFEVARELTRRGAGPAHLVVSARDAPDVPQTASLPETDAALLDQVAGAYGGVPDAVLASDELLRHFLPILRADLELAVGYAHTPGPPLGCPITALTGADDRTVSRDGVAAWARQTTSRFEALTVPGAHFYLESQQPAVLRAIHERLVA